MTQVSTDSSPYLISHISPQSVCLAAVVNYAGLETDCRCMFVVRYWWCGSGEAIYVLVSMGQICWGVLMHLCMYVQLCELLLLRIVGAGTGCAGVGTTTLCVTAVGRLALRMAGGIVATYVDGALWLASLIDTVTTILPWCLLFSPSSLPSPLPPQTMRLPSCTACRRWSSNTAVYSCR